MCLLCLLGIQGTAFVCFLERGEPLSHKLPDSSVLLKQTIGAIVTLNFFKADVHCHISTCVFSKVVAATPVVNMDEAGIVFGDLAEQLFVTDFEPRFPETILSAHGPLKVKGYIEETARFARRRHFFYDEPEPSAVGVNAKSAIEHAVIFVESEQWEKLIPYAVGV